MYYNFLNHFPDYLKVNVEVLEGGKLPEKNEEDSGWDVFSPIEFELKHLESIKLGLKIKLDIPKGYYYDLRPKSSFNQFPVLTQYGLIDEPYVGELSLVLVNLSNDIFKVYKHQKVAQLVLNKQYNESLILIDKITKNTERGEGGFGSTGKF